MPELWGLGIKMHTKKGRKREGKDRGHAVLGCHGSGLEQCQQNCAFIYQEAIFRDY